jgi:hypothetical protein
MAREEQLVVAGPYPWTYGLGEANRKNVQTVLRYCHQQGLIGGMMPVGELFADTDLGGAGGGADNISFEMSWVWGGLAPADPSPCPAPL